MIKKRVNFVIVGVSYFSSGVSVNRVRNLFTPLTCRNDISIKNLIISSVASENLLENKTQDDNIEYKVLSYKLSNIFTLFNFIAKNLFAVKKMKKGGDINVLYVYGNPTIENMFTIIFARLFKYLILFDIVEDNFTYNDFRTFRGKIKNLSSLFFIKRISKYASGTIAISNHIKIQLEKISKNKFPIELIPISVNFKYFPSIKPALEDRITLFYGGSLCETDRIDILLEAFDDIAKQYNNVSLIVTGKSAKRHLEKFNRLLANLSAKDRVLYKGFLPLDEYYNLLNSCDIMCMIRSNSAFANAGFPFKLGEYLASGKAVIATDVSDVKCYLQDGVNAILIKPDSKEELVRAMKILIPNKQLRMKIGEQGRHTARKYFDNYIVTDRFRSFLQKKILTSNGYPSEFNPI